MSGKTRTLKFRTELEQLLDIIIHSLYSEKEIFLRELISNACDAIDKARFEGLTNPAILEDGNDWYVRLATDSENGTLTVSDNGMGMSEESIVEHLGTIARSGTQEFLQRLQQADAAERPTLIGQFGVGFYSAFMVADRVTVDSKMADQPAVRWESTGKGKFNLSEGTRTTRGTEITLHLKEDAQEFLDDYRLRAVVKKYSDFVEHPILKATAAPAQEGEESEAAEPVDETLNSRKALWLRSPSDVEESEYEEFYKQVSKDFEAPARTIHFSAEGALEFRSLLFLPARKPMDFAWSEPKAGVQLYVQRVLIMQECEELLPLYLRFVRGVVDSSDLPLNVSREILQQNDVLARIRKALVNKVLRVLGQMKEKEYDAYVDFYREFGATLKEGVHQDFEQREALTRLLLFDSVATGEGSYLSLDQYIEAMPESQDVIHYLIGENRAALVNSPYVERMRERGEDVLLLTDPIDEFMVSSIGEYEGKTLQAADRGSVEDDSDELKEAAERFAGLLTAMQEKLAEVKEVRLSARLTTSASCLVADDGAMSAHLERLMSRMGRGEEAPPQPRILELNAKHPAVEALWKLHSADASDQRVEDYARLLYDQAVLAEGSKVGDPSAMARRINDLIARSVTG